MSIHVNEAGIIINSMGHPIDARKVCESYNDLLTVLQIITVRASCAPHDDMKTANEQFGRIMRIAERAIAKATP